MAVAPCHQLQQVNEQSYWIGYSRAMSTRVRAHSAAPLETPTCTHLSGSLFPLDSCVGCVPVRACVSQGFRLLKLRRSSPAQTLLLCLRRLTVGRRQCQHLRYSQPPAVVVQSCLLLCTGPHPAPSRHSTSTLAAAAGGAAAVQSAATAAAVDLIAEAVCTPSCRAECRQQHSLEALLLWLLALQPGVVKKHPTDSCSCCVHVTAGCCCTSHSRGDVIWRQGQTW